MPTLLFGCMTKGCRTLQVLTVREILSYGVANHMGARVELEEMAMTALTYSLDEGVEESELRDEDKQYLSDQYKREVLQHMSIMQLIDTIMINPTVHISPSYRDTGLSASYTFQPLSNLVYTRDQQITTCKGIVMGRLRSSQRQLEVEVMKFCFKKLGKPFSDLVDLTAACTVLSVKLKALHNIRCQHDMPPAIMHRETNDLAVLFAAVCCMTQHVRMICERNSHLDGNSRANFHVHLVNDVSWSRSAGSGRN